MLCHLAIPGLVNGAFFGQSVIAPTQRVLRYYFFFSPLSRPKDASFSLGRDKGSCGKGYVLSHPRRGSHLEERSFERKMRADVGIRPYGDGSSFARFMAPLCKGSWHEVAEGLLVSFILCPRMPFLADNPSVMVSP